MGNFILKRASNELFYFALKAENGEVLLRGGSYTSKSDAINGIDAVKLNAVIDSGYQTNKESRNVYVFILRDCNGETIGMSEPHCTLQSLERARKIVKADAAESVIIDQT